MELDDLTKSPLTRGLTASDCSDFSVRLYSFLVRLTGFALRNLANNHDAQRANNARD
jgi:hypothetical protein